MTIKTVQGALTAEGIECQALRSSDGQLFTLIGDLRGFKAGDHVVVVGSEVQASFCQQGTTLAIITITAADAAAGASELSTTTEGARKAFGRGTYQCIRIGNVVLLRAEGMLSHANDRAVLEQMPWRIWPPQFGLYVVSPAIALPALRPFAISELFAFPRSAKVLVVHDADGAHEVTIGGLPADHPFTTFDHQNSADMCTGYSATSLQDAFDTAVADLAATQPTVPDGIANFAIKRSGLQRGGLIGLRLYYAQVEASIASAPRA